MTMICFIALLLLPLTSRVLAATPKHPETFNCAKKFGPLVSPGDSNTVDATCHRYPSYPRSFSGVKVTVQYTTSWGEHARAEGVFRAAAPVLNEAITRSLKTYTAFSPTPRLPAEIVIVLTRLPLHTIADTFYPTAETSPCQIRTTDEWTKLLKSNDPWAKQSLAHELYHCVQEFITGNGPGPVPSSLWVLDGSADYMSNVVFPKANLEWPDGEDYDPTIPIYAQAGGSVYQSSLYFQSLQTLRGVDYLNNWVLATQLKFNEAEERQRLSTVPRFTADFYVFARQFCLGEIMDSSGVLIQGLSALAPGSQVISVPLSQGIGTGSISATPFTIEVSRLSLALGHTYTLTARRNDHQRVAYRLASDASKWITILPGSKSAPIELPCDGNSEVLILFISTKDSDSDAITITATQKDKNKDCSCRGGTRRSLLRRQDDSCPPPSSVSISPPASTGSCKATTLKTDPCLTAHDWKLNLPALKALMLEKFSPGVIKDLRLSGTGTLTFAPSTAHFTYTNFEVDFTEIGVGPNGGDLPGSLVVNGECDANVVTTRRGSSGAGDMCLIVTAGQGSAIESDDLTGGFTLDLTPDGGFVEQDYDIKYICSANALSMEGYLDGNVVWGPYAYSG